MKRLVFVLALLLAIAPAVQAQPVTPLSVILWDQAAPDLATASGYTYAYYADGAATGKAFPAAVTCAGVASPFVCKVAYPAFTPGTHTIAISATNVAGESPKSAPLSFTFAVVPTAPVNLRSGN